MNRKWKRRIKKLIAGYYKKFGHPELMKITKIETLPNENQWKTGCVEWYGYYDHKDEKYFFDEITIRIHPNIDDEAEKIVVLHETAHVIQRLELRKLTFPFNRHTNDFYNIAIRIDPDFRMNNFKQKFYRK